VDLPYPGCPEPTWTRPLWTTAGRPKPEGAHYCAASADRAIRFVALLHHFKGDFAGQPFLLLPWQEHELFRPLFGWKTGPCEPHGPETLCTEPRLFRTAYVETPKKNGKTQLGAGVAGYMAFGDGEAGAEIYTYAADEAQAKLAFDALGFGVSYKNSPLEKKGVQVLKTQIKNARTRSFVKVQSGSVRTKHGPNAQCIIFDELHAQPNRELWDTVTTGVAARRQPLVMALTTAGWDRNSICFEEHDHARQVAEAIMDDPTFLGLVYSAPETADWTKPETWYAAAPSLGVTVKEEFYVQKAREAEQMPTAQNAFRQLFLSQWTQQAVRVIPLEKWDACPPLVGLETKTNDLAYGGLDLAATTDLSAFALLFPTEDGDYDTYVRYWIPAENIRARELRDRVPYRTWVNQGLIEATPGDVIDYAYIKAEILKAKKEFNLREISYDPWNAVQLVTELENERVKLVPMRQGYQSQSPPLKELLRLILEGRLRHGDNPVLRWNADSAAARSDPAGNIKLDKSSSTARIDGLVAVVMALDAALRNPTARRRSVYETEERGVLT
jgi:phage terminase large subunit-like protein